MSTIKLTILAAAVVVGIPTASAFATQFGRDRLDVESEQCVHGSPVTVEIKRDGMDSIYITKDSVISRPHVERFSDTAYKPGRG